MIERVSKPVRAAFAPNMHGARVRGLWIVLVVTTGALVWQFPEQAWVLVSKLNRIALGAALGVLLDRAVFWFSHPTIERDDIEWQFRRAALMIGGMLAAALAL